LLANPIFCTREANYIISITLLRQVAINVTAPTQTHLSAKHLVPSSLSFFLYSNQLWCIMCLCSTASFDIWTRDTGIAAVQKAE